MSTLNGSYYSPRDIVGAQTTGGAPEETLSISINGATPADSIAIGPGYWLFLKVFHVTAEAAARFRLDKTVDGGANWFPLHHWRQPQDGASGVNDDQLVAIEGGVGVLLRARVTTPGGAAYVSMSMHGYVQPS
jgi:hypothetical protein